MNKRGVSIGTTIVSGILISVFAILIFVVILLGISMTSWSGWIFTIPALIFLITGLFLRFKDREETGGKRNLGRTVSLIVAPFAAYILLNVLGLFLGTINIFAGRSELFPRPNFLGMMILLILAVLFLFFYISLWKKRNIKKDNLK
jgi:hypothetical protein